VRRKGLWAHHFEDFLLLGCVLGEERVGQNLGQRRSEERALRKQGLQEGQGVGGYVLGIIWFLGQNLVPCNIVVIVIKGQLSAKQRIEDDA
jgi:hypothetical protein